MKHTCVITAFFMVALSHPLLSQDLYHSPYSVYGLGILNDRTSSLNRSLGGTGIAVQDEQNLNHANPASYSSTAFPLTHIFEAGSYVEYNRYATNRLSESKANGGMTNLSYWFRFAPWYSSAVGIAPFSSVSYNIRTNQEVAVTREATYVYTGNGNITELFWGHGFRIGKNLSVGSTVSYLFGSINRDETIIADETGTVLTLQNKTFSNKFKMDVGIQYKVNLIGRTLVFGAIYKNGLDMKAKNNYILMDYNSDTLAQYKGENVEFKLPRQFGAGISLKSKRSVLATDLKFTPWSSTSYPDQGISFRDSRKISAGYSYYGNEYAENYLGMIGIRFGLHFQEHPFIVKDTPMNAWGATFGVSLPVADGRSLLNINYAFDQMGTLENNLILHNAHKIHVDIVIRDIWGIKRKFN